jgi:DNA polymerase III delta subunit
VRRFEKLLNIHPVVKYLESPNVDSILVLLSEKNKIQKSVTDATEKKGQVCICWPMFQNESERWIDHKLAQLGIEADTDAVKYIIELTGTSTQELSNQIEYISNYLERGEALTLKTVKSILARLYHYTVFDLCNALFIKTAGKIVEIFRYLVHIGEDPVKIIYFCGREMRKILNAHALTISGYDYHDIIRTLKFRKSEADRIKTILRVIDTRTISTLYARLADLDYTLKSNPKEIGMLKLEKFLVELGR